MAYLFKRGSVYYVKFYVAGKQKEKSLGTGVSGLSKTLGSSSIERHPPASRNPAESARIIHLVLVLIRMTQLPAVEGCGLLV